MKNEISTKGYPPTIREICQSCGIASTSTVHKDIKTLVEEGYLKKDPSKPRALMIIDQDGDEAPVKAVLPYNIVEVPVVGRVAAGEPIFAEQNIEDTFPLPDRFINGGNNFKRSCCKLLCLLSSGSLSRSSLLSGSSSAINNGSSAVNNSSGAIYNLLNNGGGVLSSLGGLLGIVGA